MQIKYTQGDATQPIGEGTKIIAHVCNDIGGWGRGFVMAISNKWKRPEKEYRNWAMAKTFRPNEWVEVQHMNNSDDESSFELGHVQFVKVEEDIWIANMIAQRDVRKSKDGTPPIRYDAVRKSLARVSAFAKRQQASVHMPRIGCGLAGGKWEEIEPLINEQLIVNEVEVVVYDFG